MARGAKRGCQLCDAGNDAALCDLNCGGLEQRVFGIGNADLHLVDDERGLGGGQQAFEHVRFSQYSARPFSQAS